eukprot:scaffold34592_cov56-Isochrysis_galbana.AAC.1
MGRSYPHSDRRLRLRFPPHTPSRPRRRRQHAPPRPLQNKIPPRPKQNAAEPRRRAAARRARTPRRRAALPSGICGGGRAGRVHIHSMRRGGAPGRAFATQFAFGGCGCGGPECFRSAPGR